VHCSFPDSKLSNLDFSQVQMKECNFFKTVMKNCVLQQLKAGSKNERKKFNLCKSSFVEADLTGTIFFFCDLKDANFQKATLDDVVFEKCNLQNANFKGASIVGINFTNSKIENTILDIEGFLSFGNSKGFVLEDIQNLS
jgi:uncharacterized protein YjbI with pentapeptide repeats